MIPLFLIQIKQPIGTFYSGHIMSDDLIKITFSNTRKDGQGNQRRLRDSRLNDISNYCSDPDAVFPTPIIVSIDSDIELEKTDLEGVYKFYINDDIKGEILDGQHRINGIFKSGLNIDLPVIFMFKLTEEEKGYIFSTINSNQQKVDKSLIYDLFELSTTRSPYKTSHELARLFNTNIDSPFYKRLKMLESRTSNNESISQGTFVKGIVSLYSKKPQDDYISEKKGLKLKDDGTPLRQFYLSRKDEIIYKILYNCFNAVKNIFPNEWENPRNYVLTKTVCFNAIIKFLKINLKEMINGGDLSNNFFYQIFDSFKMLLQCKNFQLTSEFFKSGETTENDIAKMLTEVYKNKI